MPDNEYSQVYGLEDVQEVAPKAEEEQEEVQDEVQEDFVEEEQEEEQESGVSAEHKGDDEHTEAEKEAMSKGWRPEGVPGKRALSAEEFLDRESFYSRIHKLEKMNENLQGTVEEMVSQHSKIAEIERNKVIKELKEQKKVALAEEDYDAVIELDDRLAEAREVPAPEKDDNTAPAVDPDFVNWQSRNQWYDQARDPELYEEATTLGFAYKARNPQATSTDVYNYVENTVKRMHPDKFEGGGRKSQAVEGGRVSAPRKRPNASRKYTKKDLNDNQRRVMATYVKRGVMSEDEYITELAKIGEIG